MKLRTTRWFDLGSLKEWFGVQGHFEGRWVNVAVSNKALMFETEKEAKDYVREHNKKAKQP